MKTRRSQWIQIGALAALGLAAGFVPAALMNRSITRSQEPEFAILKQLR